MDLNSFPLNASPPPSPAPRHFTLSTASPFKSMRVSKQMKSFQMNKQIKTRKALHKRVLLLLPHETQRYTTSCVENGRASRDCNEEAQQREVNEINSINARVLVAWWRKKLLSYLWFSAKTVWKSSLQLHYTIPLKIYVTELLMKEMK